jgi:membrane-associated protease RseP (regulator of RpoE activity)
VETKDKEMAMFAYEQFYQQQTDVIARLRQAVEGLFHVADIRTSPRGDAVMFVGQLLHDAESDYGALRERFRPLGYTPILRREGNSDIVVAQRGVVGAARFNPLINVVLLVATIFTTLFAGASFAGVNAFAAVRAVLATGNLSRLVSVLEAGAPFALTLLFILAVHEMGHYVAARLHGLQVTLPYFIPVPFGLGTFGAFIQMKSPVENRKALFDVGLAGPLAGFVVAVPLMVVGLLQSEIVQRVAGSGHLGSSLLLQALMNLIAPHAANQAVQLSPIAMAAWFGLLVTGFNLLPMGQLDGGHIAYAVLGKAARPLAIATFALLLVMGFTLWGGWLTWAFLALIIGLGHAEPLNDITPLDGGRRFLGLLTLGLFFLLITPKPF